jgi:hypothetical protein
VTFSERSKETAILPHDAIGDFGRGVTDAVAAIFEKIEVVWIYQIGELRNAIWSRGQPAKSQLFSLSNRPIWLDG